MRHVKLPIERRLNRVLCEICGMTGAARRVAAMRELNRLSALKRVAPNWPYQDYIEDLEKCLQ